MAQKSVNSDIINQIMEYLDEGDWSEGLDLYHNGRVRNLQLRDGLLTADIESNQIKNPEVRMKLHSNGKIVHWLECSCPKNRKGKGYCEHIIALLLSLSKENRKFVGGDSHTLILPKPSERKKTHKPSQDGTKTQANPKEQLLAGHQIVNVTLLDGGPNLRVRLELRKDLITYYDLKLDDAATFIKDNVIPTADTKHQPSLRFYAENILMGTKIGMNKDGSIVAGKVFAFTETQLFNDSTASQRKAKKEHAGEIGDYRLLTNNTGSETIGTYLVIPYEQSECYMGERYCFLAGVGYFSLPTPAVNTQWHEMPFQTTYRDDDAGYLVERQYAEYIKLSPVLLDIALGEPHILSAPTLSSVEVHANDDNWFYISPMYSDGSSSISMTDMIKHLRKRKRTFIQTKEGWIKIPDFLKEVRWDLDESGQYLKASAIDLLRIKATMGEFDRFTGSRTLLDTLRRKTDFNNDVKTPDLDHTNLDLREYQKDGLNWLWWLYENKMHGLLADEMGLGKTHQAMALMAAVLKKKDKGKFLIICPTSVLEHWLDKINQFAPVLRPILYYGNRRMRDKFSDSPDHSAFITSFGVLIRDVSKIRDIMWDAVIVDEAHFAKNSETATYQALCLLNSEFRLCLTGTPIENHLGELKNIFDFLLPGFLGSDKYFKKHFQQPIEINRDAISSQELQRLILPFKCRRIKKDVLKDLPNKIEDIRHCYLSEEQAGLYHNILTMRGTALINQLGNENESIPYLHIFATLTLLKQICNHPSLVISDSDYRNHSSKKFDLLKELLSEALASNLKVVIYSQYVKMIDIIDAYLREANIGHAVLTGQTKDRGKQIYRFQNDPSCQIFLGSLLAGGIGIDLTAASVVIHYDRWWNPSKENQATDRVHRFGQNKNVQVIKIITKGTLEEKIDQLISKKKNLIDQFVDNEQDAFKQLNRQDLIDLLR